MQWQQTAISRLQRSAHVVDMRLMRPRELLQRLQLSPNDNAQDHELQRTLDQLRHQDGVIEVKTEWYNQQQPDISRKIVNNSSTNEKDNSLTAHLAITPPVLNETNTRETVSRNNFV